MKKTIGILAHVDAGKTTFCEQLLFHAHALRVPGRVDHQNAFLDIHPIEKSRGITIFSDQASFEYEGDDWTLIDTPGHADFSSEMERALSVMDFAVLIVSCVEGIQSNTETVWRLLGQYNVPTFIFINKTDRSGADCERVIRSMRERMSSGIIDLNNAFLPDGSLLGDAIERVAENDEQLLENYLDRGYEREPFLAALKAQIRSRTLFPLMSGSALRDEGVEEFLHMLSLLSDTQHHLHLDEPFCARAAKLRYDAQGNRLSFIKILSGRLKARDEVQTLSGPCKVNELRIASGARYRSIAEAEAGDFVAVAGLKDVKPGELLGASCTRSSFCITPLMSARLIYPKEVHPTHMLEMLRRLEDEEPMLQVNWNAQTQEIEIQVMGAIQLEVLRELMRTRFETNVDFGPCRIAYKESIASTCYGIGHYEPLKHYAEVHLKLEPAPRGSGISFSSAVHVDELALNWQRLIETHVFETTHHGVLTGAPLTDIHITLIAGRAHIKHTEGGDFRESTYRAIRNALMSAQSLLLEPICHFELRAPSDALGRIMSDMTRMRASTQPPELHEDELTLSGEVPFASFMGYPEELLALTHGRGSCYHYLDHYAPCPNAEAIILDAAYNPHVETPDSVFCTKGAGVLIPWDKVREHAHLRSEANP